MDTDHITTGCVLTKDHKKIFYDHYLKGHRQCIVLAHGFYNSKQAVLFKDMAKALNDEYDVIVMDFRGHGKSDGPFDWTAKEYQDLEAILGYAKESYEKIGVVGFSLGAATSLIVASRCECMDSLISRSVNRPANNAPPQTRICIPVGPGFYIGFTHQNKEQRKTITERPVVHFS